jgi:glycosyltransferase involved in cell wall biosynthesis
MTRGASRLRIASPMATGNGAYVVHQVLARHCEGYRLFGFDARWTLFPPSLPLVVAGRAHDVVHTTPDHGVFFKRGGRPLLVTFHNYVLDRFMAAYSSPAQRFHYASGLRLYTQLAVRAAAGVSAVSHATARLVRDDLHYRGPIHVIHNGVDADKFRPCAAQHSSRQEVSVLFAGNLTSRKGAELLPAIARRLGPKVRIYYTLGLRAHQALPSTPNLCPLGAVPHQAMAELYRRMDMLLLPTVREGCSLAVLEAMACGLPVVASRVGSLEEQVDDGCGGFLCRLHDAGEFAGRINLLADSPALRKEAGAYNRSKVEEFFTLERMVARYERFFAGVACGR